MDDLAQPDAVVGEDDLLHIVLRNVGGGEYSLDVPTTLVVWEHPDRSGLVTTGMTFDAGVERTLYVEAIAEGEGILAMGWAGSGQVAAAANKFKIYGILFEGPAAVPGHSQYDIQARTYGVTDPNQSGFISPVAAGGTFIRAINNTNPDTTQFDTATVLWNGGPVVGKTRYQGAPGFVWKWSTYVVEVSIKPASIVDVQGDEPDEPGPVQDADFPELIHSTPESNPKDAMEAYLIVDRIVGPTVNGKIRGVRSIEMGFIQNVQWVQDNGDFDFELGGGNPTKRQTTLVDGNWVSVHGLMN